MPAPRSPISASEPPPDPADVSWSATAWILVVVSIYPLFYVWQYADPLDRYPYAVGAVGGGLVGLAVRRAVGRFAPAWRARLRRALSPGGVVLFLGPLSWGIALVLVLNVWLDRSAPTTHASQLLGCRRSYKSPTFVLLASWRTTGGYERVKQMQGSPARRLRCEAGTPLVVTTRQGAFGWAWIASIRPAP